MKLTLTMYDGQKYPCEFETLEDGLKYASILKTKEVTDSEGNAWVEKGDKWKKKQ